MSRRAGILAVAGAALAALAVLAGLWWWSRPRPPAPVPVPPPEDRLELAPATFADLPGWGADDLSAALPALRRSCSAWSGLPDERPLGGTGAAGTVADWRPLCSALGRASHAEPAARRAAARALVEEHLAPWAVTNRGLAEGLFTGYYEPTLHGSLERDERHRIPLYARPPELVAVDLGAFRDDLEGRRIAGRVEGGRLVPFAERSAIDAGALAGRGLEVVWVDDPVDAFFLHIQGSGVVRLAGGGELRLGYAAQNGHPYRAVGRELVEWGEMELEEVSMQSIRGWMERHPQRASELMATNRSYVFFRVLDTEGPVGSLGVVLTPGRSLAVDPLFLPLGAPLWLAASAPAPDPAAPDRPLRRLVVAQDTGGAIRGPVRGDVFWGPGDEAAEIAGRMRHPGRLWLLLPRGLDPRRAAAPPRSD